MKENNRESIKYIWAPLTTILNPIFRSNVSAEQFIKNNPHLFTHTHVEHVHTSSICICQLSAEQMKSMINQKRIQLEQVLNRLHMLTGVICQAQLNETSP